MSFNFMISKMFKDIFVEFDLKARSKPDVIEELVELASKSKFVKDKKAVLEDVQERESIVTTGVGYGLAFPNARSGGVKGSVLVVGRSKKGIDFDSVDKKPVHLFFLIILVSKEDIAIHINAVARLSYVMKTKENRKKLMEAKNPEEVIKILDAD